MLALFKLFYVVVFCVCCLFPFFFVLLLLFFFRFFLLGAHPDRGPFHRLQSWHKSGHQHDPPKYTDIVLLCRLQLKGVVFLTFLLCFCLLILRKCTWFLICIFSQLFHTFSHFLHISNDICAFFRICSMNISWFFCILCVPSAVYFWCNYLLELSELHVWLSLPAAASTVEDCQIWAVRSSGLVTMRFHQLQSWHKSGHQQFIAIYINLWNLTKIIPKIYRYISKYIHIYIYIYIYIQLYWI